MKKRIIILGGVVLLTVLGWSAYWLFATHQIRQQIDMLALSDGELNPQLRCGTLSISGYPFNFDIACENATLVSGDVTAEIAAIRATTAAYQLTHITASALGPVALSDAFTGQRSQIDWEGLQASLRIDNSRIARLSIVGTGLSWQDQLFGDALIAASDRVELHVMDMPERHEPERGVAALALYAMAQGVSAPGLTLADGASEIEAEMTGLPDNVFAWGLEPFLPAWQAAGGELNLVSVRASDANADLEASGHLALNPEGLLDGTIGISSAGVAERIGPMIEEPWRTLVLGTPGEDGRHTNQLNFRAGAISSGLVPIGAVPSLFTY